MLGFSNKINIEKIKKDFISALKLKKPEISPKDLNLVEKGIVLANEKHKGQKRLSGEPFFLHPLSVAYIAIEYNMDISTIVAALLHDIIEDTHMTYTEVKKEFNEDIAFLVKGVTNITNIKFKSKELKQLRNYTKLLFAMAQDVRVLFLKLFDRLHNARTFATLPEATRKRKAFETLEIFLPLAERIGMDEMKNEFGDICLKWLYPDTYKDIKSHLKKTNLSGRKTIDKTIYLLKKLIKDHNIDAEITGRLKEPYSIWRKMNKKGASFDKIFDIIAFRFITKNPEDCYRLLGIIHSEYKVIQGRFKDYISFPKQNNYQSLHTSVIGPTEHIIEVQIRTEEMENIANYGIASHWQYKQGNSEEGNNKKTLTWIRNIVENMKNAHSRTDAIESTKISMFSDSLMCFTPKGEVITLPEGSTVLDFAYAIHTQIGNTCLASKVNRVIKNIRHKLNTGDLVEIITSSKQSPAKEWLRFAKTPKAKNNINKYIVENERKDIARQGKSSLEKTFEEFNKKILKKYLKEYMSKNQIKDIEELYFKIGTKKVQPIYVLFSAFPEIKTNLQKQQKISETIERHTKRRNKMTSGIEVKFAKCCSPIPNEKISGILNQGKDITIHRSNCNNITNERNINNLIVIDWNDIETQDKYNIRLFIICDAKKAFTDISNIVVKLNSHISNIRVLNRGKSFFELIVDVDCKDSNHLNKIIQTLKGLKSIKAADRYFS